MKQTAAHLRDALLQVDRDLTELAEQVEIGEIGPDIAESLRSRYLAERFEIESTLDTATANDGKDQPRSMRRMIAGTAIVVAGFGVLAWGVAQSVQDREPGDLITGGISQDVLSEGVDLSQVTNEEMEAVIADNPEIAPMRIALARRYFQAGEFDKALDHYLVVLEQGSADYEVLANVGWITYLGGEAEVAERYVTRSIDAEANFAQAYWYLGNIRLFGLSDPAGAIDPLERLLTFEELPAEIVSDATALLDQAEAAS